MEELLRSSLVELTRRLHSRDLSPVELMETVLDRHEATHETLNAVVVTRGRDELMAAARRAEERLSRGEGGPVEGVPLGVKDLEDVRGLPTSHGSQLWAGETATRDSTQVARLKAAGAIVFGKTNTPEFGFTAITKNLVFGVTRSPWSPEHTPGGSSGGSAAALAGCVLPLVTASDGGGSIRIPASFTGAFGLKPSFGRVPRGPLRQWDYGVTSVYGPLVRTVEDGALFLDLVCGPHPLDPASLPSPVVPFREAMRQPLPRDLRIGYAPDLGYAVVQPDVADRVREAVGVFEGGGFPIVDIEDGPGLLADAWGSLGDFEILSAGHERLLERPEDVTRALMRALERVRTVGAEDWGAAARRRYALVEWVSSVFDRCDLLLTPTVPFDPPPAGGPFPTTIDGREVPTAGVAAFTIPFNLSWNPAATVRAGLSEAGLPVGLQIVGPRHSEELILRAAAWFESERPWHPDWPDVVAGS